MRRASIGWLCRHCTHECVRRKGDLNRLALFAVLAASSCWAQISTPVLGYLPVESRVRVMHGIPAAGQVREFLNLDRELGMITGSPRQDYLLGVDATGAVDVVIPGNVGRAIQGASPNPDAIVVSPRGMAAALIFTNQNRVQVITGLPGSPVVNEVGAVIDAYRAVSDDGTFQSAASPLAFFNRSDSNVTIAADAVISGQGVFKRDNSDANWVAMTSDDQQAVIASANGSIALVNLSDGSESDFDCECRIEGLFGLGNSVFRLNDGGFGQAVKLFDAANAGVLSVPVTKLLTIGRLSSTARPEASAQALPAVTIGGLPATSGPAQQPSMTISIASPYPTEITGTATLTFTSAVGGDDQTIQFATMLGGRAVTFTIPAGQTQATFSNNSKSVGVIVGTVSGTIKITLSLSSQGTDITPSPAPSATISTLATVPFIQTVQLAQSTGGFQVLVTGFSSTRDMVSGTFHFAPSSNATLATTDVTVQLGQQFAQWYSSTAANAFGSQFLLTVPFTTAGGPSGDIVAVTVTLTNSKGASNPAVNQ